MSKVQVGALQCSTCHGAWASLVQLWVGICGFIGMGTDGQLFINLVQTKALTHNPNYCERRWRVSVRLARVGGVAVRPDEIHAVAGQCTQLSFMRRHSQSELGGRKRRRPTLTK